MEERIIIKAHNLERLKYWENKLRKKYRYASRVFIEREAWNAYLKERKNNNN